MNLSEFSLLKDDTESYSIGHPQGRSIQVPKKGLSDKAHAMIKRLKNQQAFPDGGAVQPESSSQDIPYNQLIPQEQAQNASYMTPQDQASIPVDMSPPSPPQGVPASAELNRTSPVMGPQNEPQLPEAPGVPNISKPLAAEAESIAGGVAAEKKEGLANEAAYNTLQKSLKPLQASQADNLTAFQEKDAALFSAMQAGKINPDRYLQNMGTGSKIASSIGMILGGMGSGLTGGPNVAVESLNNAINRDMEAQRNDQSKNMNLWKMNREAYSTDLEANLATQNQMLNGAKYKVMANAAAAQGPLAQSRAAALTSDIGQKMAMNNNILSIMKTTNSGGFSQSDPSQLVPYLVRDPAQQKQVYEEIGRAQNVSNNSQNILKSFDDASKDNTLLKTGGGYLRTPGSVMNLHQLLLPNFKQIDGTVRQAAMDETFHNVTPSPGDMSSTTAAKRDALVKWMHSETAAPTAKGNNIDLSKFASTTPDPRAKFTPQQQEFYNFAVKNPQDQRSPIILKKLGIQ
jgi:hypothetical protein